MTVRHVTCSSNHDLFLLQVDVCNRVLEELAQEELVAEWGHSLTHRQFGLLVAMYLSVVYLLCVCVCVC